MRPSGSTSSRSHIATAAIALELFLSIGALLGGGALMLAPRGGIIPLPVSALNGSPFDSYFVPGLILFSVLGLGPLGAAALVWLRHPLAPLAASVVGVALLIWLAVEIGIVGYTNNPPLQPIYSILGAAIVAVGLRWLTQVGTVRRQRPRHGS